MKVEPEMTEKNELNVSDGGQEKKEKEIHSVCC